MLLLHRREMRAREDYALHLLWLIGLQLFSLSGGSDYPVPTPAEAFLPVQEEDAAAICHRILQHLQEERSDA